MNAREVIKKNFSRSAKYYDQYCAIQNLCAGKLIEAISRDNFQRILDVGCGTGTFTARLRERFPAARITAIDISEEMATVAREKLSQQDVEIIVADAETMELKGGFDLICSNAALHWFIDLRRALSRYQKQLNDQGMVIFSIFGPRTFQELSLVLKQFFGPQTMTAAADFRIGQELKLLLDDLFQDVEVIQMVRQEKYGSLIELLRRIKHTGASGQGLKKNALWTLRVITQLEKIYREKFTHIVATYEVFFCRGKK